jgi:hypothetical protein
MKPPPRPQPPWLKWMLRVLGVLMILAVLARLPFVLMATWAAIHILKAGARVSEPVQMHVLAVLTGEYVGLFLWTCVAVWLLRRSGKGKVTEAMAKPAVAPAPVMIEAAIVFKPSLRSRPRRWSICNILRSDADTNRLWQFDAKGGGFVLSRELQGSSLPARFVAKSWSSLWQPKLNIAWLPPEDVFLRVIELPKSNFDETLAMVELQLEKLSPIPVTQIVWTMHVLSSPAGSGVAAGNLQTLVVVIVARSAVEEFLGKLEARDFQADRLEVPFLDQLEMDGSSHQGGTEADAWIYPLWLGGQSAALVAWWCGGALRSLSFVTLPPQGDRAAELKKQLALLAWSGELEGWLAGTPKWHLVADPVNAAEWENALREGLAEPVRVSPPLPPADLAARTARRAAAASERTNLLPAEFSARYQQQFVDRLWLRGLGAAGILYAVGVAIYFCATGFLALQTHKVEQKVATISGDYTNAIQLKARYGVLKERQELKYAALDCWKTIAEQLPEGVSLQRFSFADGSKLSLNGTCDSDQIDLITEKGGFYDKVRFAKLNGQPMFDSNPNNGEQLLVRQTGSKVAWSFGMELQRTEAEP